MSEADNTEQTIRTVIQDLVVSGVREIKADVQGLREEMKLRFEGAGTHLEGIEAWSVRYGKQSWQPSPGKRPRPSSLHGRPSVPSRSVSPLSRRSALRVLPKEAPQLYPEAVF